MLRCRCRGSKSFVDNGSHRFRLQEGRLHALVAQTFDVYDIGDAYREFVLGLARVGIVLTFRGLRVSWWVGSQPERSGEVRGSGVGRYQRPGAFRPPGLHRITARPDKWVDEAGGSVDDPAVLERLRRLAIPPAWVDVWASADANASVQATGVDQRGRTQYRYSPAARTSCQRLQVRPHDTVRCGHSCATPSGCARHRSIPPGSARRTCRDRRHRQAPRAGAASRWK